MSFVGCMPGAPRDVRNGSRCDGRYRTTVATYGQWRMLVCVGLWLYVDRYRSLSGGTQIFGGILKRSLYEEGYLSLFRHFGSPLEFLRNSLWHSPVNIRSITEPLNASVRQARRRRN